MSDVTKIVAEFARALASGDTSTAHEILSREFAEKLTAVELSSNFNSLTEDMGGVTGIGQPMVILEEWPDMSAHDQAMVYVPLEGDEFSEAITVTVSNIEDVSCISSIEWGRP